jgi:Fe-S cluster assembly protein SufD
MTTQAVEHYLSQVSRLTGLEDVAWLEEQRQAAMASLSAMGFPDRKVEDWKYTDVSPILKKGFNLAGTNDVQAIADMVESAKIENLDCTQLVFIDGRFTASCSDIKDLPANVSIGGLKETLINNTVDLSQYLDSKDYKNGFVALNTSLIDDGAVIKIDKGVELSKPMVLLFVSTGKDQPAQNIRNLIIAGANSRVDVIESYTGPGTSEYFTNTVTEIFLDDGAGVNHYKIQEEGDQAYHVGNLFVKQQGNSTLNSCQVSMGGALARSDIDINLIGANAEAQLYGLYMGEGTQHIDHHTTVNHISPHTHSNETYRGVLGEKARGVFNGKIIVHKDAQKTEAHLSNANLLLSSKAEVDTKPELEIYADDVKCSHGSTIGRLDDTMLYYLRTRAISEDIARSLLTFAFAEDVIEKIKYPQIVSRLQKKVIGKLPDSGVIEDFVA